MNGSGVISYSDQTVDLSDQLAKNFQSFYDGTYKDIENYINKSAELWEGDAANEAISKARQYMAELNVQREKTLEAARQISKGVNTLMEDVNRSASMIDSLY